MQILDLNHIALHVADLEASCKFYGEVLNFTPIPRPAFSFAGAWFGIGPVQQLHLIAGRTQAVLAQPRGNHFAVRVPSVAEAEKELLAKNITFQGPQLRPDGMWQIFIRDPDGHFVELTELPE